MIANSYTLIIFWFNTKQLSTVVFYEWTCLFISFSIQNLASLKGYSNICKNNEIPIILEKRMDRMSAFCSQHTRPSTDPYWRRRPPLFWAASGWETRQTIRWPDNNLASTPATAFKTQQTRHGPTNCTTITVTHFAFTQILDEFCSGSFSHSTEISFFASQLFQHC